MFPVRRTSSLALIFAPAVTLFLGDGIAQTSEDVERFEFTSYVDVEEYFDQLGYTRDTWMAGDRSVPRLFLTRVPERWRDKYSKEVTVQSKKRIFFRVLAPLVLRSNELVLKDRNRLIALSKSKERGEKLSTDDEAWLASLARSYRVIDERTPTPGAAQMAELTRRVDIVPVSLTLSQAAEESGWATSRFADVGNSLFGQWSWGDDAIKPEQQREGMGNYGLAAFETPFASVIAYMKNLNTHPAYERLRAERAKLREQEMLVTGTALVPTLDRYSERGEEYVKSLQAIIRVNRLAPADSTYLRDMAPVYLVPVGEQSK